jgi:hypothetical protein
MSSFVNGKYIWEPSRDTVESADEPNQDVQRREQNRPICMKGKCQNGRDNIQHLNVGDKMFEKRLWQ